MAEIRRAFAAIVDRWRPLAATLAVIVLANVLLHALVIRRLVEVSGDREAILATRREALQQTAASVEALERTASKLACTRSDVSWIMEEVLSSKTERLTAIVREVRKLAEDNHMDPTRISYSWSPMGKTSLVEFSISFPLEGPYATLQTFISQVEASRNFLIIQNVTLSGERASGANLKLEVKLVTYFQAPDIDVLRATFARAGKKA